MGHVKIAENVVEMIETDSNVIMKSSTEEAKESTISLSKDEQNLSKDSDANKNEINSKSTTTKGSNKTVIKTGAMTKENEVSYRGAEGMRSLLEDTETNPDIHNSKPKTSTEGSESTIVSVIHNITIENKIAKREQVVSFEGAEGLRTLLEDPRTKNQGSESTNTNLTKRKIMKNKTMEDGKKINYSLNESHLQENKSTNQKTTTEVSVESKNRIDKTLSNFGGAKVLQEILQDAKG